MGHIDPGIDWQSHHTHVVLNPHLPQAQKQALERVEPQLPELKGHVWVASSGTTAKKGLKLIALSKEAFLVSAAAVNRHLDSSKKDVWVNPLPCFHVGGLAIEARAHLTGAGVVTYNNWSPQEFKSILQEKKATLTSLVPTQVYDLVYNQIKAPSALRVVVVGGGALSRALHERASELGWPLAASYGLTECSSQVATMALPPQPTTPLCPLDHVQIHITESRRIAVKSRALLTAQAEISLEGELTYWDPKQQQWFVTSDRGHWEGSGLVVEGRTNEDIKINGELVNLNRLNKTLQEILWARAPELVNMCIVTSRPCERRGQSLVLVSESTEAQKVIPVFNDQVMPLERIQDFYEVSRLARTSMGKPLINIF